MSIESFTNLFGVQKDAATPASRQTPARDPLAPTYKLIVRGGRGAKGVEITEDLTQFIRTIRYEDNSDQFDQLEIVFENQIDNGGGGQVLSLLDNKLLTEGVRVELKIGYGRTLRTVGAAEITGMRPDFPSNGPASITFFGFDLLHRASRRRPRGGVSYAGFRDSQIASIIGERNGFEIAIKDPKSFDNIIRTRGIFNRVQKKGVSDYEFLKKVADINGFDLYSRFDEEQERFILFFGPPENPNQKEVLTFIYNEGEIGYFNTLMEFSPELQAQSQSTDFEVFLINNQEFEGSKFKVIDQLSREEQQRIIKEGQSRFTGGNVAGNAAAKRGGKNGMEVAFQAFGRSFRFPKHKRFTSEDQAKKAVETFIRKQKENFITGDGVLIGNEIVQSRQVHRLEGIGNQFSGKYFFTKVVHEIDVDAGYTTSFQARKVVSDEVVENNSDINFSNVTETSNRLQGFV